MKQKFFFVLAALMLMGTSAMAQSETLKGDVNGDGRVNARDARALLMFLAGLVEENEVDQVAADFNNDGKVNARDARAILIYIAQQE